MKKNFYIVIAVLILIISLPFVFVGIIKEFVVNSIDAGGVLYTEVHSHITDKL